MTLHELVKITGLSGRDFARTYEIPYRTLQNWLLYEDGNQKAGRCPPSYILKLLERAVISDLSF